PATAGTREWAALFLLPFGWLLLPVIGWIAGVMFLWSSRVWTMREKVIGTVVVPGGLSAVLILSLVGTGSACSGGGAAGQAIDAQCTSPALPSVVGVPLLVAFVLGGVVTPVLLGRRALAS
ncbi:MAG TPA: hypothetical protein VE127_04660, partial [Solirubrobacteraceae bacterium]|nr:hypothetical protein [Solirubrobacteraceae bacterium]